LICVRMGTEMMLWPCNPCTNLQALVKFLAYLEK
jgi:hypothetical protein